MTLHADRRRGDPHRLARIGIRMAHLALQLQVAGVRLVAERQWLLRCGFRRVLGAGSHGEKGECDKSPQASMLSLAKKPGYFTLENVMHTGVPTPMVPAGSQATGPRVQTEEHDVVGSLVGREQVAAGRVDCEIARRLALCRRVAGGVSAPLAGSMRKMAMESCPRLDAYRKLPRMAISAPLLPRLPFGQRGDDLRILKESRAGRCTCRR